MKQASLIIFRNLWDGIKDLNNEQKGQVLNALCSYVYEEKTEIPEDANAKFVFNFYKKIIDENAKKYEEISVKRSLARSCGTKHNKTQQNENNENQTKTNFDKNQQNSVLLCNKNKKEKEKEKKKENENKKEKELISPDGQKFVELWNKNDFLKKITGLTDKRKNKLRVRISEFKVAGEPLEVFKKILDNIGNSEFLKGNNSSGWTISFDWLINNENNWRKVYEGNYSNDSQMGGGVSASAQIWQGAQYNENDWE